MRIYPILHWTLAGVGMLVLFGRLGASSSAGWIAAVTYVFSAVSVSEVSYTHLLPGMTLLPSILYVVIRKEMRLADSVWLGLLFGLDMFARDVLPSPRTPEFAAPGALGIPARRLHGGVFAGFLETLGFLMVMGLRVRIASPKGFPS
jgi:hypothetical protein